MYKNQSWIKRNWANALGIVMLIVLLPAVRYIYLYMDREDNKKLKAAGIECTARVTQIYRVKIGVYVQYKYTDANGGSYEQDETFHDMEEVQKQGIRIGNCYKLIYYKFDPEIRKIDFSRTVNCSDI